MKACLEELKANAEIVSDYIDSLQGLLIGLYDADVWEMSEWDWQWPDHSVPDVRRSALSAAAPGLPSAIVDAVRALYDTYDHPPALAGWASQWDGSETLFLRFMHDKLEGYRVTASLCFDAAHQMLLQA